MKNRRKLPSRLCALLLAMALLCSIGIPQAAAAGGSVSWSCLLYTSDAADEL